MTFKPNPGFQKPTVVDFLAALQAQNPEQHALMQALRELLFAHYPAAQERLMYGGIMFSFKGQDFGGIFPRKAHVSFEFGGGRAPSPEDKNRGRHSAERGKGVFAASNRAYPTLNRCAVFPKKPINGLFQ